MKYLLSVLLVFFLFVSTSMASSIEHIYRFVNPTIKSFGDYQTIVFSNTQQTGLPGQPQLPYHAVSLLLPPGEVIDFIEVIGLDEVEMTGSFNLFPTQYDAPISIKTQPQFLKNEAIYNTSTIYPSDALGNFSTQFLNGFSFAVSVFTPLRYNPASGKLSYYSTVKVIVHTRPDHQAALALKNLSSTDNVLMRVRAFAQNPAMINQYPLRDLLQTYQLLIICPNAFVNGFSDLTDYYTSIGISSQIVSTESIYLSASGSDRQEKIRNFIRSEYQNNSIEYVILGGDTNLVPSRGLYCLAHSSSDYEDYLIPADLYYSAMDGSFDLDADHIYGELTDAADLLPEIAVGRFPIDNAQDLQNMIHKSVTYQTTPIMADMNKPIMIGELLMDDPLTYGQDYLRLLIDDHTDNGYSTFGIPSATNDIDSLYDEWVNPPGYNVDWSFSDLTDLINAGSSFIHHVGHSSETYMMRMNDWDLDNTTFASLNGISHSYGLLYTHGCLCGAFDYDDCIAEQAVSMSNFLASGIFNSRYGWFNQGQTEGPSQHLHREFISAIYDPMINSRNLGNAFVMSKIETAPWVDAVGEFEPGAQRWVHYDNNILGDPVLRIWVNAVETDVQTDQNNAMQIFPNPSNGLINIQYPIDMGSMNLCIYNSNGAIIYCQQIVSLDNPFNQTLDLSFLPAGIYLIRMNASNESASQKLIIQ